MLNEGKTIELHSGKGADTGPSKGASPEREWLPMPAVTTLDNVVEQIVRNAQDDDGGT
jgi:hypothetical protein